MQVLVVSYNDFRPLCDNNRIYYFEGPYYFDFHILSSSVVVKTRVIKDDIDNYERFFSERMFFGAIRLLFNVKMPQKNVLTEVEEGAISPVELTTFQDEEMKNKDIQKEGVDDEERPY